MTELVVLRAADEASLLAEISRIAGVLDRVPDVPLADVAYTCSLTRGASALSIIADEFRRKFIQTGIQLLRELLPFYLNERAFFGQHSVVCSDSIAAVLFNFL